MTKTYGLRRALGRESLGLETFGFEFWVERHNAVRLGIEWLNRFEFGYLVIVIYLLFEYCYLGFNISITLLPSTPSLQYSGLSLKVLFRRYLCHPEFLYLAAAGHGEFGYEFIIFGMFFHRQLRLDMSCDRFQGQLAVFL